MVNFIKSLQNNKVHEYHYTKTKRPICFYAEGKDSAFIAQLHVLFEAFLHSWEKETAYPVSQNDETFDILNDPTFGQAAVTAMIVHDCFGGEIYNLKTKDGGSHYFNKINGKIVDLTRDQFDLYDLPVDYFQAKIVDLNFLGTSSDTSYRYNRLNENIKRYFEAVGKTKSQDEMSRLVPEKLREIEDQYDVKVLWAVESGSRAWGFESPDSDFDVRFIYCHKRDYYLQLNPERDVIELPIDDTWDVSGWDLDKALKLLYKSNPTLFEWLQSPIIYHQTDFIERIRPLADQYFSEKRTLYHYLNTAKNQMRTYLSDSKIKPKKYFYALRPILACRWIEKYQTIPPILFDDLVEELLPESMKPFVSNLLDIKMNGPEGMEIEPIQPLHEYLVQNIQEMEDYLQTVEDEKKDWSDLNCFFIDELNQSI